MKRLFSLVMALALILSLSVTAFAATGSLTITNTEVGKTYTLYKIFDATYGSGSVTYTIKPEDKFFAKLFGADGNTSNDYFEYHSETNVVTRKTDKTDAELFTYLGGLIADAAHTATDKASSNTLNFDNLETGYYVIDRTDGTITGVAITNVNGSTQVNDKNNLPGGDFKKDSDTFTAAVGDEIKWTLSFTATNYDKGKKVQTYVITDTLSPEGWAKIDTSSIVVKVGGTVISDWKLVSGTENGFEITIPWMDDSADFKYPSIAGIEVTYSATVQESAATNTNNKNDAKLTWYLAESPTTPEEPGIGDSTETPVYNLGFTKVDGSDPSKTLPGATFELYSDAECNNPVTVSEKGEGVYVIDATVTTNSVVTPDHGQVVILGLDRGTYYLKETDAPAGYNLLTEATAVIVGPADPYDPNSTPPTHDTHTLTIGSDTYTVDNAELKIANNSGVELPSTGGEGTMMLITIGTMLAIGFAVLLITHKKMSIYHD